MTHIWVRAEQRANEERVALMPEGAARLLAAGFAVSVEQSDTRVIDIEAYRAAGCAVVPQFSWPDAPRDAFILGLKELDDDGRPLVHRHIMFGHAFKGQKDGERLLARFAAGGGALYDLEYLTDAEGRRVAAFGYWAGFAGAAVALKCWAAQKQDDACAPLATYQGSEEMIDEVAAELNSTLLPRPRVLVVGAGGRVGSGARALCAALGIATTDWDIAETASGGPFPQILDHDILLNCILAMPGCPVFVPANAGSLPRRLSVIGDIACDPGSDFNPIKVYGETTGWDAPALRAHEVPPLDVVAIDNLPSLLPAESSADYAGQLLGWLEQLAAPEAGTWGRARAVFDRQIAAMGGTKA